MDTISADLFSGGLATALGLSLVLLGMVFVRMRSLKAHLAQFTFDHEAVLARLENDLARERQDLAGARTRIESWIGEKTEAQTRLRETEDRLATAVAERDSAIAQRDLALEEKAQKEQKAALQAQQVQEVEKRLADWEAAKMESLQAAKAAVLTTANELSSKLLEDHKRETAEAKREAEERIRKTTEDLFHRMQEVTKSVAALDKQVDQTRERMETIWSALSSPGGAGQVAEIGLENTMKNFGLEKGRDFLVQSQVEGSRLRPDAMVFLPGDAVLVIDSKASKHLLDLAAAEGGPAEEDAYRSLAKAMSAHLKALADKNYRAEIMTGYRQVGRAGTIQRIVSVMYLPNEGAIEKLRRADAEFLDKARRLEISIAGPTALYCLIAFASIQIDFVRRIDNQEQIVQATQGLLDCIGVVVDHTEGVGKGIKTAADSYLKLTGSINGRLLPRVRGIVANGVRPTRSKPLREHLPSYQVVQLESGELIEGELETVEAPTALADRTGETAHFPPNTGRNTSAPKASP